jgi:hypothetical protein
MTVAVTAPTPAQTYGPPERCHDGDGGAIEPDECECGERVSDDAFAQAGELHQGLLEDAAEAKAEAWRERNDR